MLLSFPYQCACNILGRRPTNGSTCKGDCDWLISRQRCQRLPILAKKQYPTVLMTVIFVSLVAIWSRRRKGVGSAIDADRC